MPDREKVLKALEHHKETAVCIGCPYAEDIDTAQGYCPIYDDAIALLREQEPVGVEKGIGYLYCGGCKTALAPLNWPTPWKFCPWCGRKVAWK